MNNSKKLVDLFWNRVYMSIFLGNFLPIIIFCITSAFILGLSDLWWITLIGVSISLFFSLSTAFFVHCWDEEIKKNANKLFEKKLKQTVEKYEGIDKFKNLYNKLIIKEKAITKIKQENSELNEKLSKISKNRKQEKTNYYNELDKLEKNLAKVEQEKIENKKLMIEYQEKIKHLESMVNNTEKINSSTNYSKSKQNIPLDIKELDSALSIVESIHSNLYMKNNMKDLFGKDNSIDIKCLEDKFKKFKNCLFLFSIEEDRVITINNIKTLLGWSKERFIKDFNLLIHQNFDKWKNALIETTSNEKYSTKLSIASKTKQNNNFSFYFRKISKGSFSGNLLVMINKE